MIAPACIYTKRVANPNVVVAKSSCRSNRPKYLAGATIGVGCAQRFRKSADPVGVARCEQRPARRHQVYRVAVFGDRCGARARHDPSRLHRRAGEDRRRARRPHPRVLPTRTSRSHPNSQPRFGLRRRRGCRRTPTPPEKPREGGLRDQPLGEFARAAKPAAIIAKVTKIDPAIVGRAAAPPIFAQQNDRQELRRRHAHPRRKIRLVGAPRALRRRFLRLVKSLFATPLRSTS